MKLMRWLINVDFKSGTFYSATLNYRLGLQIHAIHRTTSSNLKSVFFGKGGLGFSHLLLLFSLTKP